MFRTNTPWWCCFPTRAGDISIHESIAAVHVAYELVPLRDIAFLLRKITSPNFERWKITFGTIDIHGKTKTNRRALLEKVDVYVWGGGVFDFCIFCLFFGHSNPQLRTKYPNIPTTPTLNLFRLGIKNNPAELHFSKFKIGWCKMIFQWKVVIVNTFLTRYRRKRAILAKSLPKTDPKLGFNGRFEAVFVDKPHRLLPMTIC